MINIFSFKIAQERLIMLHTLEIYNQETSHTHKCRRQRRTEREGHEKCNARQQELQEVKREREREMGSACRRERENKQNHFSTH